MRYLKKKEIIQNKNNLSDIFLSSGIYFLIQGNEIVYVGQTKIHFATRISKHINTNNIKFNSFYIIPFSPNENLNIIETKYIVEFSPRHNSKLPQNSTYLSRQQIKKFFFGVSWTTIKKGIKKDLIHSYFNGKAFNVNEVGNYINSLTFNQTK